MSILINSATTFIVQGITGREAVNLTRENLDYGAKIVGGVTPGRAGREVYGVQVYDCVRDITAKTGVDGSVVCVPPRFTRDAVFEAIENGIKLIVFEAIENGIKLIVVVTERIPRREVAQMIELASLRGARIIGPNCLGIISPGEAKMGGVGGPAVNTRTAYTKGSIGVMSRSGGMTTEIASTLTAAGMGQSTAQGGGKCNECQGHPDPDDAAPTGGGGRGSFGHVAVAGFSRGDPATGYGRRYESSSVARWSRDACRRPSVRRSCSGWSSRSCLPRCSRAARRSCRATPCPWLCPCSTYSPTRSPAASSPCGRTRSTAGIRSLPRARAASRTR